MAISSNTDSYIEIGAEPLVGQAYEVTYTSGDTSSYGFYINEPVSNYFTFDSSSPITFIGQDNGSSEQSRPEKKNIRKVSRFELMDLD